MTYSNRFMANRLSIREIRDTDFSGGMTGSLVILKNRGYRTGYIVDIELIRDLRHADNNRPVCQINGHDWQSGYLLRFSVADTGQ